MLNYGETVNVSCTSSSNIELDSVHYTWIFNDNPINDTSFSLTVTYNSTESVEQGGIYQCYVHTPGMVLTGTSNKIMIAFAPFIYEQPQAVFAEFGDSAFFNCSSTGFPLPVIEWYIVSTNVNISNIEDIETYSLKLVHNDTVYDNNLTTSSTLFIDDVMYNDYGYYICVAVMSNESLVVVQDCCSGNGSAASEDMHYTISDTVTLAGRQLHRGISVFI